ncbi:MAG: N-acetylmuramic acid 6-phosphate etherase [Gemmatimonadota bacterium]|nr:N-acetylmuramic acid 6-phosphate etherase [Gemmatimonadota bacterium]MDH4350323.1 N-acetylmuramic acid 6-phosphate etherase [Gemmatimonadota bacterium]MDH5195633.1 N-acetylmuramic acid 6-phosphate etherase [Gemmatimonadota bacterium]
MPSPDYLDPRLTERRNPRTVGIDVASALQIVDLLNAEDRLVAEAVYGARRDIAAVIELVVTAFRQGGRLIYVGAGTSGRLGVLDASECPPTFGTPPEMVIGLIAGGAAALVRSQEGAEDDAGAGAAAIRDASVEVRDVLVGIAASGTTPFVRSALGEARRRGATTVMLTCSDPPPDVADACDRLIVVPVGPEAVTGSTRLKAGTATKLVLNTLTTGAMVRLGKTLGNLMVDLQTSSTKLHDRSERIVMEVCDVDRPQARAAIAAADGRVKLAIVMARRGVDAATAERLLEAAGGAVRRVIGDPPPVIP